MTRHDQVARFKNATRPTRERLLIWYWDLRPKEHEFEVLAIFKNEARNLEEWIKHYQRQGAQRINLINNNSDDDYMRVLVPWISQGFIRLWNDSRRFTQSAAYSDALPMLRKSTRWLLVCDLDEFAYARCGFSTIRAYLETVPPSVSCVQIPWKVYASSGHTVQPPGGVVQNFLHRYLYTAADDHSRGVYGGRVHCKYIARLARVRRLCIHRPFLFHGTTQLPTGEFVESSACQPLSESLLADMCLHLNHYQLQSEEHFLGKIRRGDAASLEYQERRTMDAFRWQDHNDVLDDELACLSAGS